MNRKGFTLVEIMIVVSIMGVLLVVAIPNFTKSRQRTHLYACISNLKGIDNAKEIWAMESGTGAIGTPSWSDLVPDYLSSEPSCPSGGACDLGDTNTQSTCTVEGHSLS
ncbi:MAG: prepilin-type N-terminal cleavage/methylation domain-containing protein [Candidatus Aadella gelida]|nr:prepilin-type N-terminal cleavage/methylation domain-containing protein [Candidatus Aadella gelida]